MSFVQYDEGILYSYAQGLYDRARLLVFYGAFSGFVIGFGGLAIILHFNGGQDFLPGALAFGAALGVVGGLIGHSRGFKYRLQAQLVLCQMQIEKNTRAAGQRPRADAQSA
jgi:hypothetical protein